MVEAGVNELLDLSPEIADAYNCGDLPRESLLDYVVFTYQAMVSKAAEG
ncbi:hypothetical protein QJS25_gp04 [Serratia phage vB_SmaS_Bonzee]|nr:hypothetical protein QJS25_gp04 [Serratia phage vB_SmaS_Bonzee]UKL15142.1 hypothetical protein BONZEE_4 [Serratia phage vB_SmaS_Bonzee]